MTPQPLPVAVAAASDTGRIRSHNEDAFLVDEPLGLFAVADGVGGHTGGYQASQMTVTELPKLLRTAFSAQPLNLTTAPEIQNVLDQCIEAVNAQVYASGSQTKTSNRMGTTLTGGLFLKSGNALIFNVGDSRTYRYRHDQLDCVTTDQSWYQFWMDNGQVGAAPPKNVILQGIGLDDQVMTDWVVTDSQPNDLWLMCSDGLSDLVSEDVIVSLLQRYNASDQPLATLCDKLIKAANDAGGEDNITVLAMRPN